VVATPGRLVDMFGRKHTAFDLSACVKALVIFYMMIFKKMLRLHNSGFYFLSWAQLFVDLTILLT